MRQRAKRRKRILIGSVVAVALVAVTAFGVQRYRSSKEETEAAARAAGCSPIEALDNQGARHLQPGETYDDYNSSPPTSGPHSPQPAAWGFSAEPITKEALVHSLEHGGVIVHYKGLSDEQVDQLETLADAYADGLIAHPNDSISTPIAMTAWTRLQTCQRFSTAAVEAFVGQRCGKGPEKIARCRR